MAVGGQPNSLFKTLCESYGLPTPQSEFSFHPTRRWRFDFCWPEWKVSVEVQGGIWSRGRHVRAKGYLADMEKFNAAQLLGWKVFLFTPQQITSPLTYETLEMALK